MEAARPAPTNGENRSEAPVSEFPEPQPAAPQPAAPAPVVPAPAPAPVVPAPEPVVPAPEPVVPAPLALPLTEGCVALPNLADTTVHEVNSDNQADLVAALAAAQGGDVVLLKEDSPDTFLKIDGYNFDPANPVWIIGDGVALHSLTIQSSSGLNLAGINFQSTDGYTLLKIVASQNIRVLRNAFDLSKVQGHGQSGIIITPTDEPALMNSSDLEIGCNRFENIEFGAEHSGSFIKTQFDSGLIPTALHIHHNHFANIEPVAKANGFEGDTDREALVFGEGDSQDVATNYLVEFNLFEDCDGENEIITVKTSNNTIRHNTFINNLGSVSVRFGTQTHVYGNYFFANDSNQHPHNNDTGGIRVYGSNHLIFNNYFEGLRGTGFRMPILVDSGDTTDSSGGNKHERSSGIRVLNNTIVNCNAGLGVGSDNYSIEPTGNTIANNLIVGTTSALLDISAPIDTVFENNMGFGGAAGNFTPAQLVVPAVSPLSSSGGVFRLTQDSPARDVGSAAYSALVAVDIEGQMRNMPDIGADEYSAEGANRRPLVAGDVGPGSTAVVQ